LKKGGGELKEELKFFFSHESIYFQLLIIKTKKTKKKNKNKNKITRKKKENFRENVKKYS
jgi:hypothetical protein